MGHKYSSIIFAAISMLLVTQSAYATCYIYVESCRGQSSVPQKTWFLDPMNQVSGQSKQACVQRSQDYHNVCASSANLSDTALTSYASSYYNASNVNEGMFSYFSACNIGNATAGYRSYYNITEAQCFAQAPLIANQLGAQVAAGYYDMKHVNRDPGTWVWNLRRAELFEGAPQVLVTGFLPWANHSQNFSQLVAERVPAIARNAGFNVEVKILPVEYVAVDAFVNEVAARANKPKFIVNMGIYEGLVAPNTINVEPYTLDFWSFDGSSLISFNLPNLSLRNSPEQLSFNALLNDGFICNYISAQMLRRVTGNNMNFRRDGVSMFLHLPNSQSGEATNFAADVVNLIQQLKTVYR